MRLRKNCSVKLLLNASDMLLETSCSDFTIRLCFAYADGRSAVKQGVGIAIPSVYRVLLLENELEGRPDKTMGRFIWSLFVLFGAFLRQRVIEQPSSSEWISGEFGMTSGPPSSFFLL